MDIKRLKLDQERQDEGVVVKIVLPDNEPDIASTGEQATFTMLGRDAKRVRRLIDKQQREWARHRGTPDPEKVFQNRVDIAVEACVAWNGIEADGKPFPLTPENARIVFSDRHYLEQAEEGIYQHARFFAPASAS